MNKMNEALKPNPVDMKRNIRSAYNKGYKCGYDNAHDIAYEEGATAAWELARKIALSVDDGGIAMGDIHKIFEGLDPYYIMKDYTYSEAKEKIEAWEEQQKAEAEIKVGDEVYFGDPEHTRVVTAVICSNGKYEDVVQITQSGKWTVDKINDLHKTGRHFNQINEMLEEMRK